jgi:hypothetical protein
MCGSGFFVSKLKPRKIHMKAATSFNPLNIPDLALPASEPQVPQPKVTVSRKKSPPRKPNRTARTARIRRVLDVPKKAVRITAKLRRQVRRLSKRIKGGITARLAHLDREKLKKVLIACGVAAAAVAAICLLVKLTPLIIALLAVLGFGAVLQTWDRLRHRMPA